MHARLARSRSALGRFRAGISGTKIGYGGLGVTFGRFRKRGCVWDGERCGERDFGGLVWLGLVRMR